MKTALSSLCVIQLDVSTMSLSHSCPCPVYCISMEIAADTEKLPVSLEKAEHTERSSFVSALSDSDMPAASMGPSSPVPTLALLCPTSKAGEPLPHSGGLQFLIPAPGTLSQHQLRASQGTDWESLVFRADICQEVLQSDCILLSRINPPISPLTGTIA